MQIRVIDQGVSIPSHDGKQITEFIGNAISQNEDVSVAHMLAPPGWAEGAHSTKFDELVIVVSGTLTVIANNVRHEVTAGQVGRIGPSPSVAFANQANEPCEYWAVCLPAFSPDLTEVL